MFKDILKNEFYRTTFNLKTLGAFLVFMAIFLAIFYMERGDVIDPIKYDFYDVYLKSMTFGSNSYMPMLLPIIACLIGGDSLFQDIKSGYIKFLLTRIDHKKYIKYKAISVTIVTFAFLVLFQLIAFLYSYINCSDYEKASGGTAPMYLGDIFNVSPLIYVILIIVIMGIIGSSMTIISMMVSMKLKSVYTVTLTPWIIFVFGGQIINIVYPFLFNWMDTYGPINMSGYFVYRDSHFALTPIIYWLVVFAIGYSITVYEFTKTFKYKNINPKNKLKFSNAI